MGWSLDGDLLLDGLDGLLLWAGHLEHAILVLGGDGGLVGVGQTQAAMEPAHLTLLVEPTFALLFVFLLALTRNAQQTVLEIQLDVFLGHAGQLSGHDDIVVVVVRYVHPRRPGEQRRDAAGRPLLAHVPRYLPGGALLLGWLVGDHGARTGARADAADVVEEGVHLALHLTQFTAQRTEIGTEWVVAEHLGNSRRRQVLQLQLGDKQHTANANRRR
mmetsp:Transcript_6698/g.16224  ORF Transcript_6698/g.16224 Transcript_6698/m.16224 type:complete len:217 (-) Transcript_6698:100-750(-)